MSFGVLRTRHTSFIYALIFFFFSTASSMHFSEATQMPQALRIDMTVRMLCVCVCVFFISSLSPTPFGSQVMCTCVSAPHKICLIAFHPPPITHLISIAIIFLLSTRNPCCLQVAHGTHCCDSDARATSGLYTN